MNYSRAEGRQFKLSGKSPAISIVSLLSHTTREPFEARKSSVRPDIQHCCGFKSGNLRIRISIKFNQVFSFLGHKQWLTQIREKVESRIFLSQFASQMCVAVVGCRQCDEEGIKQNALVPSYHCMHTPGGPLKYSLGKPHLLYMTFKSVNAEPESNLDPA